MSQEKWAVLSLVVALLLCVGTGFADTNQSGNVSNSAPNTPSVFTPTSTQNALPTLSWTRGTDDNSDGVRTWWNITLSDNTTLVEDGTTVYGTQGTSDTLSVTVPLTSLNNPYTVNMWSEDNSTSGYLNSSVLTGTLTITPPNAPTSPVPSNNSDVHQSIVSISWTNGTTTNPTAILRHDYQWCNTDATCASPSTTVNATAPQTQTGLVQETTYYWRVRACDYDTNTCSAYTGASFTFTVTNTAPSLPSTFTPTITHNPSQTLSFTRGTDADADQVRTWYNLTKYVAGSVVVEASQFTKDGSVYVSNVLGNTWQTFNTSQPIALTKVMFDLKTVGGTPAEATVYVYDTADNSLIATSNTVILTNPNQAEINFTFVGEHLSANGTYGKYKAVLVANMSSQVIVNRFTGNPYIGGINDAGIDYTFAIYGNQLTLTTVEANTVGSYGTQGTGDTVSLTSLPYGNYTVNMWSEDEFSGGNKNSSVRTGILAIANTQPTSPSLNAIGTVWFDPTGNSVTMTWTNGTDSDTSPTDTLTHYWQIASDSGYTTILDEGYKVSSATYSASSTYNTNTTFYWRVLTNDNTGTANENSTWDTDSFVVREHRPTVLATFSMTDDDLGLSGWQVNPVEATTKTVQMNITVGSPAGFADLANATFSILNGATPFRIVSDLVLDSVDATTGKAIVTFTMGYNETPTTYDVTVTAKNINGTAEVTPNTDSYTYTSLTAYTVPTGDISYGVLTAGSNSSVQTMTLRNTGNVAFQPRISGTDLTSGGNVLPSTTVWYGTVPSQTIQLTTSPQTYSETNNVYDGSGGSNELGLGWKWAVPIGTPIGTYTGTITLATA